MPKPTEQQLQTALQEAARMREHGQDPHHLARALLNLNYRLGHLQRLMHAVGAYLRSGEDSHQHAELLRALEQARRAEEGDHESEDRQPMGLA